MPNEILDDEVQVLRTGALGRLTLNRPRAINALNHAMVRTLAAALAEWRADDSVRTVLLSGAGDRGLCAGGDIVAIYHAVLGGRDGALRFWADEYQLDAAIARYPKPYVALMDGLVLGGGIGLSAHAGIRVVTERTRVGMPEVSIGFFPDVGGTSLLARAPGELGTHLALTGSTASGADAIAIGFADHFVPSEHLGALATALETRDPDEALAEFAVAPPASQLLARRSWIDELYAGDDAEAIVERLAASTEPAAQEAAATIRSKSPTSVALTLAALRRAAALPSLEAVLDQDFRVATRISRGAEVIEGIRAQVIDKDRTPHWSPATLAEVTAEAVERYFAPLGDEPGDAELGLATAPAPTGSGS
ncbi:MAG TPA: enoyl-CoA hydratase/isomerase family protein [Pseudolysinimonas sp.]|nr:enoyl-CoA hydratase/isomerase family protein [Pseudolysinimonas sp.]